MPKTMIFHHTLPIVGNGTSGSSVRPYQMIKAFKAIGYEVIEVTGYGTQRKASIKQLIKDSTLKIDFIYSESSTMPFMLTEINHLPIYLCSEVLFFRWAQKKKIPLGLYYRDLHWRFDIYRKFSTNDNVISWLKRVLALPFFWLEWLLYNKYINHLFLQTNKMKEYLPTKFKGQIDNLPPGSDYIDMRNSYNNISNGVRLFYVGGIKPPLYDLTPSFELMADISIESRISMTLCCRKEEWALNKDVYEELNKGNINIKHLFGEGLKDIYFRADVFLLLWRFHQYHNFVLPVKVFEAMSYGLPIITNNNTEVARFVEQEDIGWVVNSVDEAKEILLKILSNPQMLEEKKQKVIKAAEKHNWANRAKKVADVLVKEF